MNLVFRIAKNHGARPKAGVMALRTEIDAWIQAGR